VYGTCVSGRHTDCEYGPGRQFPNGIKLSDGTRYTCSCGCHRGEMAIPKPTAADRRRLKSRIEAKTAQRDAELAELVARAEMEARMLPPAMSEGKGKDRYVTNDMKEPL